MDNDSNSQHDNEGDSLDNVFDYDDDDDNDDDDDKRLVWLFAINRTTIPRIYSCSELVCAIVDLGIVGLSVMCAHCGHNLFIYLFV